MPMIWQAMILASTWFATKTCQTLAFSLPKSMAMFLPNFWLVKSLAWQILDVNQTGLKCLAIGANSCGLMDQLITGVGACSIRRNTYT
jgi:hypothetical protein